MASILMGVITAILIILICGVCFYVGYKVGYAKQPKEEQSLKTSEMSEAQMKRAEGFANILNHANRHRAGDNR
jgi:hypothetical protein